MSANTRNEVFNSKRLSLDISTAHLNSFTLKPIRQDDNKSQICVTFNKSLVNAISFYVSYRRKGSDKWINTSAEKNLNVINIKNVDPGVYEVRVVAVTSKQQTPSQAKLVEVREAVDSARKVKSANNQTNQKKVSQTIHTIANNLADDIIAEVYFVLSHPDLSDQERRTAASSSYYEGQSD